MLGIEKKNLLQNPNYNIHKEFDILNKKCFNIENEIKQYIKNYHIKISEKVKYLDNSFEICKSNISKIDKDFSDIRNIKFSNIISNILKVGIQNHINYDKNYYLLNIDNNKHKELFIYLHKNYQKILDNNLNNLLNSNENSLIIKFFLNLKQFTNNNFTYRIPKINTIHNLLFLINLKNYDKKNINFSDFNNNKLKENSKFIYDELNQNNDKFKFSFDINTFEEYERKYNKSNIFLNEKKKELYETINKKIIEIIDLKFINFNVELYDIINDKQKYIDFVNEKEKIILNNISNFEDFNKLYQIYSTIQKNIELNMKELMILESQIIELDKFFLSDEIVNLDSNYIINKKKLQLYKLKKYSLKISNLEDNDDLIEYNDNTVFLNEQTNKLDEYLKKDKELKKKISNNKTKIIILNQNIKTNKPNTIKINKFKEEIIGLEIDIKQHELELNDIKYEIIYLKKNINTVSLKKDLLEKKKIISENLINKINSNINNINKQSERSILDYQVFKKNLDDNYRANKNKLDENKKVYKTLLLDIKNKKIELKKLNYDFLHYKSILNDNYNEFFIIKNNIIKVVNLLLQIEKIYIEYNNIVEKIKNNSSVLFLKNYYVNYEEKYIKYIKKYNVRYDDYNNDYNSNKYELINLYYKVLNFYNSNYYYIFHLHIFNIILNNNNDSFEDKIKINKTEYIDYKNILDRLIIDCENVLQKNIKTEISKLNENIKDNINEINRYNSNKNELSIMNNRIKNLELVKIDKYLNDIK